MKLGDNRNPPRRWFLRSAAGALGSAFAIGAPRIAAAQIHPPDPAQPQLSTFRSFAQQATDDQLLEQLSGEHLLYKMTFMGFIDAAETHLRIERGPQDNQLTATIDARARGLFGWLTGYRREQQVSVMQLGLDPYTQRRRLITVGLERSSKYNGSQTHSKHTLEYGSTRIWSYKEYDDGRLKNGRQTLIPPGVIYESLPSALYNFRLGVYGPLKPGRSFELQTIPFKGVDTFRLRVAEQELLAQEQRWIAHTPGARWLAVIEINRKIYGIKAGQAQILVDSALLPLAGKINNALAFGNLETELLNNPHNGK
ncbi:MAG: DUF3108 domain-containing protein [Candidatus Alcyoniella australis]|nr:DUF3108 domain-containing protein [Candidatus Alcyoniella australis]